MPHIFHKFDKPVANLTIKTLISHPSLGVNNTYRNILSTPRGQKGQNVHEW
jgi:hypothetical protein